MAGPVPLMSQGHNDQQFGYEGAQLHFVVRLVCFSFEALKMQAFLFSFLFPCLCAKREILVPRIPRGILLLESVDYFGTSDYFNGQKKEQS